jgi:methylmalonyl-CoA epimerase
MKILGIHHLGVAVRDLEKSVARWMSLFGAKSSPVEELPERGVRLAQLRFSEGPAVELVSPAGENSPLARFLDERGEGIHHLTLEVDDIETAMRELGRSGLQLLEDRPQEGAEGSRIVFIHPRSFGGILLELRESRRESGPGSISG